MEPTPVSLLDRLRRPTDQPAWERFVQLYTPLLGHFARRLGLDGPDAADLLQDVFAVLVHKLPEFRYDPHRRFRGWLWTLTLNKLRERRRRTLPEQANPGQLAELAVADDVEAITESDYRQYLTRRALEVMRAEFQPATWQAFWECVVNDRSAADVSRELGLSENAVYLAKGRVLRKLRKELEGLLD